MAKTKEPDAVTKTDYQDGNRGYYIWIPRDIVLEFGYKYIVCDRIGRLILSAQQDGYQLQKFYIHELANDGGLTINGVGYNVADSVQRGWELISKYPDLVPQILDPATRNATVEKILASEEAKRQ